MRSSRTRRLLLMPLLVLLMAGGVLWLSERSAALHTADVQRFVTRLCDDAAAGRSIDAAIASSSTSILAPRLAAAVQAAVATQGGGGGEGTDAVTVVVIEGDTDSVGVVPLPATHHAIIRRGGGAVLGLRLLHDGGDGSIAIIGYWRPTPDSAASAPPS